MVRQIIHIDEDKCNGCGLCASACHESALAIVDGKAKLIRDDYCDGLGDCLPQCPTGALTFEMREAPLAKPRLSNWPVQLKLAPTSADYFNGASLLIAADCTAYAYANFHKDFAQNKVILIGCSKLDAIDYTEKLTAIFSMNNIKDITLLRMEVPCCGGLEMMVKRGIECSGKDLPLTVTILPIA